VIDDPIRVILYINNDLKTKKNALTRRALSIEAGFIQARNLSSSGLCINFGISESKD
jgi:hypothetical protein